MKRFNLLSILTFSAILMSTGIFAQTGPAGVGSSGSVPMWLDANELSLVNGADVSLFKDVSGNGNDMTQFNSVNRPTYTTVGLNGLPVVSFDGIDDYMERGSTSGLDGGNITIFFVYQKALLTKGSIMCAGYSAEFDKWMIYGNDNNNWIKSKHHGS